MDTYGVRSTPPEAAPKHVLTEAEAEAFRNRTVYCGLGYAFFSGLMLSIMLVPLPELFLEWSCSDVGLDKLHCKEGAPRFDEAQAAGAELASMAMLATGIMAILMAPLLGALGDAYGRRLVIVLPALAPLVLSSTMLGVPPWRFKAIGVPLLGLSACGGSTYHPIYAAFSDVTRGIPGSERSRLFSLVEAAFMVAFLLGPAIGGEVASRIGLSVFYLTFAMGVAYAILVLTTFHETLDPTLRRPVNVLRANPVGALGHFITSRDMVLLGCVTLAGCLANSGAMSVLAPYALRVSGSSVETLGLVMSAHAAANLVGLIVFMPMLLRFLSLKQLMLGSTGATALTCFLHALATQPWQLFALASLSVATALLAAIVRTGALHASGEQHYGELLAAFACLENLTVALAGPLLSWVYSRTVGVTITLSYGVGIHCPAFLVCAAVACVSFVAAAFLRGDDAAAAGKQV